MAKNPFVSVITPSFNQGRFLEATILSVLEQDYPNIEYIVIDGGSTDNSWEIIERYADRLAYWESQPDRGQAHAINKGLRRARGEFIGWLNSDDIYLPNTVSKVVRNFIAHPDVDIIYGHLERIDESGRKMPTPYLPKDHFEFNKSLVIGECIVNQPGSFWRGKMMQMVGLLDEDLVYGLDYEYWMRMALAGAKFKRIQDTVAYFRRSKSSKTVDQTAKMAEEQLRILDRLLTQEKLAEKLELTEKQVQRKARKARSIANLYASYGYFKQKNMTMAWSSFRQALWMNPLVLFQQRWLDLAFAALSRRLMM